MVEDVNNVRDGCPWLPLYRVRGQGAYKDKGSPDRRVVSLREVLANLSCKLRCLVEHVWAWFSSWSCGHVKAWCGMVLLCWLWNTIGTLVVRQPSYVTWFSLWSSSSSPGFLGRRMEVGSCPQVVGCLVGWRSLEPRSRSLGSWLSPVWMASKSRLSSWIPSCSGWDRTHVLSVHI
jgi:hypothetical protein